MHQLRKVGIDAAATLQLSRLVHPFRGIKRLLMQLNRLAPGLQHGPPHQQQQQQQQKEEQRNWNWRGTFWNTTTTTTKPGTMTTMTQTTMTGANRTLANFAVAVNDSDRGNNSNGRTRGGFSFTRLNDGSCGDVFELHRFET